MAIVASNLYAGRITTGEAGYPYGKARDLLNGEKGTGTPLRASWVNDTWGFLQALLDETGTIPTGEPDAVGASQYLDAIKLLIGQQYWGDRLVGSFEAGFTYTDINQVGTYDNNGVLEYYVYTGGLSNLPHTVTAGTNPTIDSNYQRVNYNSSSAVINDDGSTVQDAYDATKSLLILRGLSGKYGFFDKGFTYNTDKDVGIDGSGNMWIYRGQLPFTVSEGGSPSGSNYEKVKESKKFSSIAEAASCTYLVAGEVIEVVGQYINASWVVDTVDNQIPNGYYIVESTGSSGLSLEVTTDKVTLEMCGYNGEDNAGAVLNSLFESDRKFTVELTPIGGHGIKETVYLRRDSHLFGRNSAWSECGLIAKDGFVGNILDTYDFDYLNDNLILDADREDGRYVPTGIYLDKFFIKGAYNGSQEAVKGEGFGVRLYAKFYHVDVRIYNVPNVGFMSRYPIIGDYEEREAFKDPKRSWLSVGANNTGMEGIIIDGPADISPNFLTSSVNAGSSYRQDDVLRDSVELPNNGHGIAGIRLLTTIHAKFINPFWNVNGYGLVVDRLGSGFPAIRLDFDYIQSDDNYGNIYIGETTRAYGDKIETHGYKGMDSTRCHIESISTVGLRCPNVNIHRAGDEKGCTAAMFNGKYDNVKVTLGKEFGTYGATNVGHGVVILQGVGTYDLNVAHQTDVSYDGTDSAGLTIGASVKSCTIRGMLINNGVGLKFRGSSPATLDNCIDMSISSNGVNIVNVERMEKMYRQICNITSKNNDVIRYNRYRGSYRLTYDGSGDIVDVVIPHKYFSTPDLSDIVCSLSYDGGGFAPSSYMVTPLSATGEEVTVRCKIEAGGQGDCTIGIDIC